MCNTLTQILSPSSGEQASNNAPLFSEQRGHAENVCDAPLNRFFFLEGGVKARSLLVLTQPTPFLHLDHTSPTPTYRLCFWCSIYVTNCFINKMCPQPRTRLALCLAVVGVVLLHDVSSPFESVPDFMQ